MSREQIMGDKSPQKSVDELSDALDHFGATALKIKDERDKLKAAVKWVLNDAAYKAPEQITAEFVQERYLSRLQEVIDEFSV